MLVQEYNLKTKYVMKTDDDTFVRVDAVLSSIVESRHNYSLLLGNVAFNATPERDPTNKWFINTNVMDLSLSLMVNSADSFHIL